MTSHPGTHVTAKMFVIALAVGLAVLLIAGLGYVATQQWRRSARMLVERRVDEVDTVLMTALVHDMSGAHSSILMSVGAEQVDLSPAHEFSEIVAKAFARFPYPESFFAWKSNPPNSHYAVWFNRTDRPPVWYQNSKDEVLFPVTVIPNFSMVDRLVAITLQYATPEERSEVFNTSIGDKPYQVVTRLFYDHSNKVIAIIGFTVNLGWVRKNYFSELTQQIQTIAGSIESSSLALSIIDDSGNVVSQTRTPDHEGAFRERSFPFAFFDSSSVPLTAIRQVSTPIWRARVSTADDVLIRSAQKGARRTSLLLFLAAGLCVVCLILTFHSLRKTLELAAMKADFVAMVTHELKTPLSGISLVAETLSKGRFPTEGAIVEYGRLLSRETTRLKRLVENVLSFSRLTNTRKIYTMADADVSLLILEALTRLQPLIQEKSMEIHYDRPKDLPQVHCDPEEITRALENLIENAIKYSDAPSEAEIRAAGNCESVTVQIQDNGRGILPEDAPHVFERFFRGRNAGSGGSGLGLAIAHTIITDHGGDLSISSRIGVGTLVNITLPTRQAAK